MNPLTMKEMGEVVVEARDKILELQARLAAANRIIADQTQAIAQAHAALRTALRVRGGFDDVRAAITKIEGRRLALVRAE